MKTSDALWVENLARKSCGLSVETEISMHNSTAAITQFLEELNGILVEACGYFNQLVQESNPQAMVKALKLGNPRPGIMILRGKEKFILAVEGPRSFKARLTQVHSVQEINFDLMEFELTESPEGSLVWTCVDDGQQVNPELVMKVYMAPFFVNGGRALDRYARLVGQSPSH